MFGTGYRATVIFGRSTFQELHDQANLRVSDLLPNERARLHFAAAVIAAPPILVVDECTAYQKYSVRRAMFFILYELKKKGHGIYISSSK